MKITLELINQYIIKAIDIIKAVKPDFNYIPFQNIYIKKYKQTFWAQIRELNNGYFNLSINLTWFNQIKDEAILDKALFNIIIHELIHMAVPDDLSHGDKWLTLANKINKKYINLNIKASNSLEDYVDTGKKPPKWKLICPKCKSEWWYYRKPNEKKVANEYGCPICVDYTKGKNGYTKLNIVKCY